MKSLGKAELVENHGKVYCADEFTVVGWRIIQWPENNPYYTSDGKIADGRCGNEVRHIWEVPPPAPPPQLPPPTGNIHVVKKTFDPDSVHMIIPTGAAQVFAGTTQIPLNRNDNGDAEGLIALPEGDYDISEQFDPQVWTQIWLSNKRVHVVAGQTVEVEIKNQQLRPPPQPVAPPHVCPICGEVVASADLSQVVLTADLQLWVRVKWEAVRVIGVFWQNREVFSGPNGTLTVSNFKGAGIYEMEVHGEDNEGHILICAFNVVTVLPPPPPAPHKVKKNHKKLVVGIVIAVGVGVCIASAVEGWPVPCGWVVKLFHKAAAAPIQKAPIPVTR